MHGEQNRYRIYDDARNKIFESATSKSGIFTEATRISKAVLPDNLGTFESCHIHIAKGMRFAFESMTTNRKLVVQHTREEPDHVIGSFFLSGHFQVQPKGTSKLIPKQNTGIVWSHTPGLTYTSDLQPGQTSKSAYIIIKPEVFNSPQEHDSAVKNGLWDLFKGNSVGTCTAEHLSVDDHRILKNILSFNPAKPWNWLHLESKVLELVSNNLSRYEQVGSSKSGFAIPPHDIARIEAARDILIDKMENPPSIMELARLAGINEFKLKKGFKQIYSDTIYGYLRRYRMKKAYEWLKSGEMNVTEVAVKVGFTNPSAFGAAFKKQFGVNPAECRRKFFSV